MLGLGDTDGRQSGRWQGLCFLLSTVGGLVTAQFLSKCGRLQLLWAFQLPYKERDNVPSIKLSLYLCSYVYTHRLEQLSDHMSFFVQWTEVNRILSLVKRHRKVSVG